MIEGFLNIFSSLSSPSFNQQQRLQKVRNQLITCTYYNNIKFLIEKICMDIMRTNPAFNTEVLAFIQNNQPRRFIEIGGVLKYNYNKKERTVQVFMMFNQFFPNKPPYVRVVNCQKKPVNSYYEMYQSPNDQNSYVLNAKLNNLTSWVPGKHCYPVFQQIKFLLQTYPFYADEIIQIQQQKRKSPQKKKQKSPEKKQKKNQYIANRGSIYQSNLKQQKPQTKQTKQQDYNMKQCKLCFAAQSTMINTSCGHIMMCQACFRDYRRKHGTDILECPICKTKGQYIKFVQPKYA